MADSSETHPPRQALILPVSRPECPYATKLAEKGKDPQRIATNVIKQFVEDQPAENLERHVRELFNDSCAEIYRHNWLQPLRAILIQTKLEKNIVETPVIVIVHSRMIKAEDIDLFKKFVNHYIYGLAKNYDKDYTEPRTETSKNSPFNFEDFTETTLALKQIVKDFNEKRNIKSEEICIDITGGQRVFVAAAAHLTKEIPNLIFSYIRTYDQEKDAPTADDLAYTYDATRIKSALSLSVRGSLGLY